MARERASVRVGTSGYQYDHWKELFYPAGMPKRKWFAYYAEHFDTVEINNTFYRLPGPETFGFWNDQAPEGFLYALKYSRFGSHLKRLKDPEEHIQRFLDSSSPLGEHLGPVLVQLPPQMGLNLERLQGFLTAAPEHLRWALEFRNSSWLCPQTFELLREHEAALCIHDMIPEHPHVITAGWVYLRYHGQRYAGNYAAEFLRGEAEKIRGHVAEGRDVYAYFNNDIGGHAVRNALELRAKVER